VSGPRRTVPPGFHDLLESAFAAGLLDEPLRTIKSRVVTAIAQAAAGEDSGAANVDWARHSLTELDLALHMELCRSNGSGLKPEYDDILERALTREGIADLAAIVLRVARAINPALAVSTVVLYVAVWLLKAGLNRWCALPVETRGQPKSRPRSGTPRRRGKRGRRAA